MPLGNVIIHKNNSIERFTKNHMDHHFPRSETPKYKPSYRQVYESASDCVDALKNLGPEKNPLPNDPSASDYGAFKYKSNCNWDKFNNMKISESKLNSCESCPVNYMGTITGDAETCQNWCSTTPGCTAFTKKGDKCDLRNQTYYTHPTIQEDTYIKKAGTNEWVVKKDEKIPNYFRNRHNNNKHIYNNVSTQNVPEGTPYFPQPYLRGLSPDFATFKNSSVESCKQVCANDNECSGFTFNHLNNECTMKRLALNGQYNTSEAMGHTSYVCDGYKQYHPKLPKTNKQ